MNKTLGYQKVLDWLKKDDKKPFKFQEEAWSYYAKGYSGLVNAPTGFGKTFSLFLAFKKKPFDYQTDRRRWIKTLSRIKM